MRKLSAATLVAITLLALAPLATAVTLGAYGTSVSGTTTSSSALLAGAIPGTFAGAQLVYQDLGGTVGSLDSNEPVYLDLNGNGAVDSGEIKVSVIGTGTAGGFVTTAVTANVLATTGGTALNALLRFKDALPIHAEGGPDGSFNPGEVLFVDVDQNGLLGTNDLILSGGSVGSRQSSSDTDTAYHGAPECVYQGSGQTVVAAMVRLSEGCPAGTSGSIVAGGDADVGNALSALSGVVITGGDATFTAGEDAYIGSGAVASGHFRLTATGGGAARTIADCVVAASHPADGDCGITVNSVSALVSRDTASYPTIAFPAIRFMDLNGDTVFGTADRAYYDFDANSLVTPADVRINTAGSLQHGTRPVLGDSDTRAVLGGAIAAAAIIYLDGTTGTANSIDTSEIFALDLDGDGHLDFGDVPLVSGAGCTAGLPRKGASTCGNTGTWRTIGSATPAGTWQYTDQGVAGPTRGDGHYVHVGGAANVAANDLRITETIIGGTTLTPSQRVMGTSSDLNAPLTAVTIGVSHSIHLFDADASGGASASDLPYIEIAAGNARGGPAEIRLHNQHGLTFGRFLGEATNAAKDTFLTLTALAGGPTFAFADLSTDGISLEDPVFLRAPTAACGTVASTDVRMSAGLNGAAAGTAVGVGSETGRACTDLGAAALAYSPSTQPFTASSTIVLNLVADGVVSIGDIVISGAGRKVGSGDPLMNTPLAAVGGGVGFVDTNGDGAYQGGEAIVLDPDGNLVLSAGDVLLSGTGGTTSLAGSTGGGGGGGGTGGGTGSTNTAGVGGGITNTQTSTDTGTSTFTSTSTSTQDEETETDGGGNNTPGPGILAAVLIGLSAWVARRRW